VGGKVALGGGEAAQAASCRVLVRGGTGEGTGEILSAAMVAERAGWCAGLVQGMAGRLLSAGAARLHGDGTITALGTGAQFRAAGVLAKQHRLRRHGERLHAKSDHYARLTGGGERHPLAGKAAVMEAEIRRVSGRRPGLNDALAWPAARWTADQAIAAGAGVIYVEDLRPMEARAWAAP
jgi:hypothetical protein